MTTITITLEQYNKIRQLKNFAQWYIEEHKGGSFIDDSQWEEDRDDVERGTNALLDVDNRIAFEQEQAERSERTDAWIRQANKDIEEGKV